MESSQTTVPTLSQRQRISPTFIFACAIVMMMGACLVYWLEPGPGRSTASPDLAVPQASAGHGGVVRAADIQKVREREAKALAELERLAAEEAAEKARRAANLADGATEAQARREQEEMVRRRAAVEEANRSAAETEAAWKRFYRPSANCKDPAAGATVECVNEYMKAKREFATR
jgi:hypothetical protein